MIEMALVLPLFLALVGGSIDVARLMYSRAVLEADAQAAARAMATNVGSSDQTAACIAGTDSGGGIVTIKLDDPAMQGSPLGVDTGSPSTNPPPGEGLLYLTPSIATDLSKGDCGCYPTGTDCVAPGNTRTAIETYRFVPYTPLLNILNITVKVSATDYASVGE